GKTSVHVERAIRKYAPESGGAQSAREYFSAVGERVQRGVSRWASTGEVTGVPPGLAAGMAGGGVSCGPGGGWAGRVRVGGGGWGRVGGEGGQDCLRGRARTEPSQGPQPRSGPSSGGACLWTAVRARAWRVHSDTTFRAFACTPIRRLRRRVPN